MSKTPTYLLIEDRLGKDLRRSVVAQWRKGLSWNAIARDLYTATGVAVTSESLRIWFSDLKPHMRRRPEPDALAPTGT